VVQCVILVMMRQRDDAAKTDTRVAGELGAKDSAREREGIPVTRKIYPPKAASDGRMLPMITHNPSLTKVIEVFDPPGSGNLVDRIVEDIPGARKELAQRMAAEGKVRMRRATGGYVRAAADEPYSKHDQYMSDSQANRAESTAENRIREKARRKGLWHKNMEGKYKYGSNVKLVDSKSPFAYGKDAAAVRIAQITADAVKAKAEAEARIKNNDKLNDNQKELALMEAQGKIDAKAAAEKAAADKAEGDANRLVTTQGQKAEFGQTDTILKQKAIDDRRIVLENEIARLRERIDNPRDLDDLEDSENKLKDAEDALSKFCFLSLRCD